MTQPKVALVFTTPIKPNAFHGMLLPALGLERLGAAIEDIAQVELFDIRFEYDLLSAVKRFNPDIIAVNVKTTMYANQSYKVGEQLRAALPKAIMVTGGLHASACPEESLRFANYVIRGEGETSFRQLVMGDDPSIIPGLTYMENGQMRSNPKAEPPMNLDHLRPPARHLRKPHYNYAAARQMKMDILETSRGCTHACTFCSGGSAYPHKYRVHSPEYVFAEVKRMADMDVKWCMLSDDHFGDFERAEKICDLIIASGIKMAFFSFIRPFEGRMDLKRKMVEAGFIMLSYGAESPNPEQRKRYKKGHPKSEDFIANVNREWQEAGATYVGNSYVFGDVEDSAEVLAQFGTFARSLDPTYIEPLYSQPYPGTPYRDELKDKGLLLEGKSWDLFTEGRLLVKHPDVNEEQLKALRVKTWLDFFTPKKMVLQPMIHLYFYEVLGIPRKPILKHLKNSEYTLFGCYLEDKYYQEQYPAMVETYFTETIKTFDAAEMNMSHKRLNSLTDMFGLKPLKAIINNGDIAIRIKRQNETLASLVFEVRKKRIDTAWAASSFTEHAFPVVEINVPLGMLKNRLTHAKPLVKTLNGLGIIGYNLIPVVSKLIRMTILKDRTQESADVELLKKEIKD